MPTRNGSVAEAPGGGHITQWGATLDAATGAAVADGAPPVAAAVDFVDEVNEVAVPPPVADVVDVDVVVCVAEEGVVAASAGSLTDPYDPVVRAVPATPEVVVAVCAAPGSPSATSSGRTTKTTRKNWATTASDPNLTTLCGAAPLNIPRRRTGELHPVLTGHQATGCRQLQ